MKKNYVLLVLTVLLFPLISTTNNVHASKKVSNKRIYKELKKSVKLPKKFVVSRKATFKKQTMYYKGTKTGYSISIINKKNKIPVFFNYAKSYKRVSKNVYRFNFSQLNIFTKKYSTNIYSYMKYKGKRIYISGNKKFPKKDTMIFK